MDEESAVSTSPETTNNEVDITFLPLVYEIIRRYFKFNNAPKISVSTVYYIYIKIM